MILLILSALVLPMPEQYQAPVAADLAPYMQAQATELALRAACGSKTSCRTRRHDEAVKVSRQVMRACESNIPIEHCLTLVATLGESQMNSHPTCSPKRCRALCGLAVGGASRKCRVKCASAMGERKGNRARSCNDGGDSAGWLQMKGILLRACKRYTGRTVDPHDVMQAVDCYSRIVARSYRKNRCGFSEGVTRWGVSFARVAAGPTFRRKIEGKVVRLPRCRPHGYARRAALMGTLKGQQIPRAVKPGPPKAAASGR